MSPTTTVLPEVLKPHLSPSALSDYEICGRRGQYHQDRDIPRGTNLGQSFGKAWHHGLETFGLARMHYGDWQVAIIDQPELVERLYNIMGGYLYAQTLLDEFDPGPDQAVYEADLAQCFTDLPVMIGAVTGDPKRLWLGDKLKVAGTEMEVRVELGSDYHQLLGYIDTVIDTPSGPVGVDYKTANRRWNKGKLSGDPRKLVQAPLYAEAYTRITGEEMNWFVYDVTTRRGQFDRVWVNTNYGVRKQFVDRWVAVSNDIELHRAAGLDMPTNPSHFLCSEQWCSYWTDYCEMGQALEIKRKHKPEQPETGEQDK